MICEICCYQPTPSIFIIHVLELHSGPILFPSYLTLPPPTGLRLNVAGVLLTKRVPRFALPSTTIFDDSDMEDYHRPTILGRVWLL